MIPSPKYVYPWRARGGITVVFSMAILALGTLAGFRTSLQLNEGGSPSITADESRFERLRKILDRHVVVGYLSDTGPTEDPKTYYLTQYFLAPVVVAPDVRRELVVANCASPSAIPALAAAHSLTIVQDFRNGVALLQNPNR